jgi:transcription elongation factor Elf1
MANTKTLYFCCPKCGQKYSTTVVMEITWGHIEFTCVGCHYETHILVLDAKKLTEPS